MMPERSCVGCEKQEEWGCKAFKYREFDPEKDTDPRDCWVNPAWMSEEIEGEESYACPRQWLHQNPQKMGTILKFYGMYRKKFLPQSGAVVDQSNKAIEIFRVLDDVNAEIDAQNQSTKGRPKGNPFQPQ
jgi:hypothetical protein